MFMFEVDEQVAFKLKLEATISMHTIINHAVEVIEHSPLIKRKKNKYKKFEFFFKK